MHVLILPSWYPSHEKDLNGCFFREQAYALSRAGIQVGVISPQFRSLRLGKEAILGSYKYQIWQDKKIATYIKNDVFLFPKIPYIDLKRWIKQGLKLFERYIEQQGIPDVIHVQSLLLAGPLALKIHNKYKIPYCVMEHSSTFSRNLVSKWQYQYMIDVVKASSHCMAVSNHLASLLEDKFDSSEWHFSPNLLDNLFIEKNNRLIIEKNNKQFCSVANLNGNKGIDVLLKAFSIILKKYPDFTLVIAGDGPEKEKLQQLSKNLNVSKSICFKGAISREDVRDLMAMSLCYVLPSHVETFGVVVIEALSQGIPVIATRCGGPESIITSTDGILVEVNNEKALADGMIEIIERIDNYNSLDIRNHCIERFSDEKFVKNMLAVYENCISGKN
jgi:glycosyltransferase involved in cell wall biosynthesis